MWITAWGFYSMYFHLSEILVKDGDLVKRARSSARSAQPAAQPARIFIGVSN